MGRFFQTVEPEEDKTIVDKIMLVINDYYVRKAKAELS